MLTEKQNKEILITVSWCLVAACMITIFWLSSQTADLSSQQSSGVVDFLVSLFKSSLITDYTVRKTAHFLEFAGLSFLFSFALLSTKEKNCFWMSVLFTSLYAVTDEIHQIFVDGRACQFLDWLVDSGGAIFGALIFLGIYALKIRLKKIDSKKN